MRSASEPALSLDGRHRVLTPEYVEFNFVLAGLMSRFLALLIDSLLSLVLAFTLLLVVGLVTMTGTAVLGSGASGFGAAAAFVIWFLVDWGYMVLLEVVWNGQTVGKRAMGLRVIQDTGVRVGAYQSLLRNLVRPVDKLPFLYLVGGAMALTSEGQQRLGDLLAGTIVVRERRLKIPAALERPESDASLLGDAEFVARVGRLGEKEETLLFNAAMRREELSMEARLQLFSTIARRLEDDLGFVKPEHLSDEKLVLLVTAALAQRNKQRASGRPARLRSRS